MTAKKYQRRHLRERCLQILYAYEMNDDSLTTITDGILSDITNEADIAFCNSLISNAVANAGKIDDMIKKRVNNWEMDRIALIDKLLLRLGITELLFFPDIPPKVSINEVIEIAKDFSTSNSGKFLNGILDAILNDLRASGKLQKSGRGLVDQSLPKK